MVLDTSALLAIIGNDPERETFIDLLAEADDPRISAATLVEAKIVAEARFGPDGPKLISDLLTAAATRIVALDETQAELAHRAWAQFGKGRHPAALNLGGCYSYALARTVGRPLLCKGNDFPQTDIDTAP